MTSYYCIVVENKMTKIKYLYRAITNNIVKLLVDLEKYNDVLDMLSDDSDDECYIYLFTHYSIKFENVKRINIKY